MDSVLNFEHQQKGIFTMSLTITIPSDIESALRKRAVAEGTDIESFVRQIVIEEVAETGEASGGTESHAEFMAKLNRTIEQHGISNGHFDDSRESIYAGRGE